MAQSWQQSFHGKWILCGEHSVLRGSGALVFPLKSKSLKLQFTPSEQNLKIVASGLHSDQLPFIFSALIDKAQQILSFDKNKISGQLAIENDIPMGAGLGASATWCVALSKFLVSQEIEIPEVLKLATQLENLFHGESSGVDIAVVAAEQGIYFKRDGTRTPVEFSRQPKFFLSTTGERGLTRDCIEQVQSFIKNNERRGAELDRQMADCVERAREIITNDFTNQTLAKVITQAEACFAEWGLITHEMRTHSDLLKKAGALAVKPTGSGRGGYMLSLWEEAPPTNLQKDLIPVW